MVDPDELLKQRTAKEAENERLESAAKLTFQQVLKKLDEAAGRFSSQDFVGGGVALGELRQAVIEHRELFKE